MQLLINNLPFLNINFLYQKEIHNKEGKPNQKAGCYFESSKIIDYEITDDFKDIFTIKYEDILGKADNLQYKDKKFFGTLSSDLSQFGNDFQRSENCQVNINLNFLIDYKKLFDKLYKDKIITIYFKDVINIDKLNNLPIGNTKFEIKFSNPALYEKAKLLLINPNIIDKGTYFEIKTNGKIIDLYKDLDLIIDKIECENLYKIIKKEYLWKYKIDYHNYLWILYFCKKITNNCEFLEKKVNSYIKEEDDLNYFDYKFEIKIKKLKSFKITEFNLTGFKKFIYNIIKNYSLEDKFNKNPLKECKDGKETDNNQVWILSEELPVNIKYNLVLNKFNKGV